MAKEKEIRLEGAPDWYGTPLDQLEFKWSAEEKLEIERYCQKILKNVADEEMTPKERWKATITGKEKDRLLIHAVYINVYAIRTLDSGADALKPIDVYRNPKLLVKAHLATVARFALDFPTPYTLSYADELWGGRAKMIEYGNPVMVGDPPIKSMADLEGLEVPDPKKDGLYPGYLWACREMRRIYDEYGLTKVMPLWISFCGDGLGMPMMDMMGWNKTLVALRKDPELVHQAADLATQFEIKFGQAVIDVARPDELFMCVMSGAMPPKGNEWVAEYWARIGKALAPQAPISYGYAFGLTTEWLPVMYGKGALGPGSFCGGYAVADIDYRKMIDLSRERDLCISCALPDKVLLGGPISAIEEEIKKRCDYGKSYPKFAIGIYGVDYWTPQAHLDAAVAACKKYGKF